MLSTIDKKETVDKVETVDKMETIDKINLINSEFGILIDNDKSLKPKGWSFKIRYYNKVISILSNLEVGIEIKNMCDILNILREGGMKLSGETGEVPYKSNILVKIDKILKEGSLSIKLDEKSEILKDLLKIPEIGPSKADKLYEQGIRSLDDLLKQPNLINRKQLIGLRHYKDLEQKIPRTEMTIWGNSLKMLIGDVIENKEYTSNLIYHELAGSYRRGKEQSGDIDLYLSLDTVPKNLMKDIQETLIKEQYLKSEDIISCGSHKMMCIVKLDKNTPNRHLDIFIYPNKEYAFALLFATGCGEFNIKMRNYALKKGYSLSDKGLRYKNNKGEFIKEFDIKEKLGKSIISTEEDIFDFLDLDYIKPMLRTPIIKLI